MRSSSWTSRGGWFPSGVVPMVAEDGQVRKVLGVARDVTNQHRLAELLERQNRLLGVVINAAPIGISVLSGDNFVHELVNPALERLAAGGPLSGTPFADGWAAL